MGTNEKHFRVNPLTRRTIEVGPGEKAIFEVKWKAGDVTCHISHLPALSEYLALLGVNHILSLQAGKGKPPHNDWQIFFGKYLCII
jgi:hypothetical protein